MSVCGSCGDHPARGGSDLCDACDSAALGDPPLPPWICPNCLTESEDAYCDGCGRNHLASRPRTVNPAGAPRIRDVGARGGR